VKKEEVTEEMKARMSEADRQQLFGISQSMIAPGYPPQDNTPEVVHQRNFAKACKERGWRPVWHKTNKPTRANIGCPDFIVAARGRTWWLEFKRPGEELRPDQTAFRKELAMNGVQMHVVHSAQEAVDLIKGNT